MFEALYMKFLFIGIAFVAVAGLNYGFKWKNDNKVEQAIEKIVKDETGMDVDLTPFDGSNTEKPDDMATFDLEKAIKDKTEKK